MNDKNNIPWPRIGVEAVAILVSILLAFSIDAWWDERSDRISLTGAIKNVSAEVASARVEIERATKRNLDRIDALRKFVSLSPDELLKLDDDSIQFLGQIFAPPSPFDASGFALQGLLAGGNLDIIADEDLGAALIEWAQFPKEIERDYAEAVQLTMMRYEQIAGLGTLSAIRNTREDPPIPGAVPMREAVVAARRDLAAVDLASLSIFVFEDFNTQLATGIEIADRVLEASQRYVR
jgi:hypothetical protein